MSDDVFWSSSLSFLCDQLDRFQEMNKKASRDIPKNKKKVEHNERVEKQSLRKLSPQEIAELRAKVGK